MEAPVAPNQLSCVPFPIAYERDVVDHLHLVSNPINHYAIATHLANVQENTDGSLDMYIQNVQLSSSQQQANWRPAPSGVFFLIMRVYWPQEPVLNGPWLTPAVNKTR